MEQWSFLLLPALFLVMMYFMSIRPESKKRKEQQSMRDSLKVGDDITTVGGMVGKVVHIKNDLVTFETGEDRVRVQIIRNAIARLGKDTGTEEK